MKYKITKKQTNTKKCLVCGLENKLGLKTLFYELENKEVVGICTIKEDHQGYTGIVHGGITAALLDETIGRAMFALKPDQTGVTLELNLNYKKIIPVGEQIKIIGRITNETEKVFHGTGEIYLQNGEIAATATAVYFKLPSEKINLASFEHGEAVLDNTVAPEFINI